MDKSQLVSGYRWISLRCPLRSSKKPKRNARKGPLSCPREPPVRSQHHPWNLKDLPHVCGGLTFSGRRKDKSAPVLLCEKTKLKEVGRPPAEASACFDRGLFAVYE